MVTNNKVLTVSYGTFSCTLEGFDDSFDTMKAIAEYFRDLAGEDRYFGAEPPTPDAEMLTRIAEREIERRVEARHEDGAIVLSAETPAVADVAAEKVPAKDAAEPGAVDDDASDVDTAVMAAVAEEAAPTQAPAETAVLAETEEMQVVEPVDALVDQAMSEADEITEVADVAEEEMQIVEPEEDDAAENLFDEEFPEKPAAPSLDGDDSIAAKLRRIRAVVSRSEDEADEDDFMEDQHAEDDIAPAASFDAEDTAEEETFEEEFEAEAEPAPVAPTRARVIRMKRTEFEDAVASGILEEEPSEDVALASSLSDDDEAELMAELADLDAELDQDDAEDTIVEAEEEVAEVEPTPEPVEAEPTETPRARRKRRASLDQEPPQEAAVDRLIEEANSKLDEPEGNRRRNAIAHLRAAVAATKAEKDAGKSLVKDDQEDVYRDDLASAMRPKEDDKPRKSAAPLKLVAAQRIDADDEAPAAKSGVRPRRVSPEDLAAMEANAKSSDFVEFAESMGATQLPDVLEAAASYLTFVEGRRKFSRPMLMRLAYQVGDQRFEREAGLRSFGQLLREKKIEKIAGGRFTASDSISFKPGDRAAG